MFNPMGIYKGVVVRSVVSTGDVYVKIPSILGDLESVVVSKMNMYKSTYGWGVPAENSRVLVIIEDKELTNVYLLNPPPAPTGI